MEFLPKPRMSNYQNQTFAPQVQKSRVIEKATAYDKFKAAFKGQSQICQPTIQGKPCYFCQDKYILRHKQFQSKEAVQDLTTIQCSECSQYICQKCRECCELCQKEICKLCVQITYDKNFTIKKCQQCSVQNT